MSSGFSPIYTPSPGSSATFGDSAYGSISMTPPTRNRGGRVTKKAKKDTPKAAEARLPGFSIMTKDGIDVTNSAGRVTKSKEQREHAHLMRIMKACDSCKKKKIRVSFQSCVSAGRLLIMSTVRSFSSKITQRHVTHIYLYNTNFFLRPSRSQPPSLYSVIISRNKACFAEQLALLQSFQRYR